MRITKISNPKTKGKGISKNKSKTVSAKYETRDAPSSAPENESELGDRDVRKYRVSSRMKTVVLEFSSEKEKRQAREPSRTRPPRSNSLKSQSRTGARSQSRSGASRSGRSQSRSGRSQSRSGRSQSRSGRSQSRTRTRQVGIKPGIKPDKAKAQNKAKTDGTKGTTKIMQVGKKKSRFNFTKNDTRNGIPRPEQRNARSEQRDVDDMPPTDNPEVTLMSKVQSTPHTHSGSKLKTTNYGAMMKSRTLPKGELEGIVIQLDDASAVKSEGRSDYDPRGEIDYESFVGRPKANKTGDDDWVNFDKNASTFQKVSCRAYLTPRLCAMDAVNEDESFVISSKSKNKINTGTDHCLQCQDQELETESIVSGVKSTNGKNIFQCKAENEPEEQINEDGSVNTKIRKKEKSIFESLTQDRQTENQSVDGHSDEETAEDENDKSTFASSLHENDTENSSDSDDSDSDSDSGIMSGVESETETAISKRDDAEKNMWYKRALCMTACNLGSDYDKGICHDYDCTKEEIEVEDVASIIQSKSSDVVSRAIETAEPTVLYAALGTQNWNGAICRLLEAPNEASVWVDTGSVGEETVIRFLPLHIACLSSAPLLLVTLLVQTYPDSVGKKTMGKLPIHMACDSQADHRVVFLLLNSMPSSLHAIDDEENTPVEVASLTDPCIEKAKIIQVLTHRMENIVVTVPTALYAAIDSHDWNYAIRRLVEMPQEATTWVSFTKSKTEIRFLPLHAACLLGAPLLLVADLIQAYPFAVRKKTVQGKLPLHIACASHCDCRVISLLLEAWSDSVYVTDNDGNTPLSAASQSDMNSERKKIMAVVEEQLGKADHRIEFSPTELYSLIEAKEWDAAVKRLLEAPGEASIWVGSCIKKENVKLLPLHVACMTRAPLLLVAVLSQTYPAALQKTAILGKLPIHFACEKRADHRVVSLLLHSWPDSYLVKDSQENTCVQSALLSQSGKERTKNLETLMTFEARIRDSSFPSSEETMDKYVKEGNKSSLAAITTKGFQVENDDQGTETEASNGMEKVKKDSPRTKNKKSFFGRKKDKRNLWKDDGAMFAE